MRRSLPPIVADIVLDNLFKETYEKFNNDIKYIKNYVGDGFLKINKNP